jgi:23S rRNA pseudouridine2604 synthase
LTTLKLNKTPSEQPAVKKSPVRRADPAKRDRSRPPPAKPSFNQEKVAEKPAANAIISTMVVCMKT